MAYGLCHSKPVPFEGLLGGLRLTLTSTLYLYAHYVLTVRASIEKVFKIVWDFITEYWRILSLFKWDKKGIQREI